MFFYQFMDFVKKLASGELGVDDKNEVMQQKNLHYCQNFDFMYDYTCI